MKNVSLFYPVLLLLGILAGQVSAGWSQTPFVCNGDFFLSLTQGGGASTSRFFRVVYNGTTVTFNNFTGNVQDGINSIGYRSTDNFIYGVNPDNLRLYRIDAQGNTTFLAQLNAQVAGAFYAGDITPDGNTLVLMGGSGPGGSNSQLLRIDLTDPNYPVTVVSLSMVGGGPSIVSVADITFDPTTGTLYGYDSNFRRLLRIDQRTGVVDDTRYPGNQQARLFGGFFFDSFGQLYGYGTDSPGQQNQLYAINKNTGTLNLLATGPAASGNDGCSCPYRVEIQMDIEPRTAIACDTLLYTLRISNSSGTNRRGVDLDLPLPAGFLATGVRRNPYGVVPSGLGTNVLSFSNLTIPLGIDSIVVEVLVPGHAAFQTINSQAVLSNLPASMGGEVNSDDPTTSTPDDSTTITILSDTVALPLRTYSFCTGDSVLVDRRRSDAISYQWGDGPQTGARYINQPGTYTLITDNDCVYYEEEIQVIENPLPVIDAGPAGNICEGDSYQLQADGGQTYQWEPSPFLSRTDVANPVSTPSQSTNFIVTGTDANGCSGRDTVTVAVRPAPILDAGTDRTVCAGDTITIGTPPIGTQTYQWEPFSGIQDPGAAQTSLAVPPQSTGSLVLQATNVEGCTKRDTLELIINALEGQSFGVDIACFGEATGEIRMEWQGQTPVDFQWVNIATNFTVQDISLTRLDTVRGLPAGTYAGFAVDANGCRWWDTLTLAQPAGPLTVEISEIQNVDCFGNQNGEITVQASGGTPPYQYSLDNSPFGPSGQFTGLGARAYRVVVRDLNGCTDTLIITLQSPTGLFAVVEVQANPRCHGDSSGWVRFMGNGGQPPYAWSEDGVKYSSQTRWDGYDAGLQVFFLRDANGCIVSVPVIFRDPPPLVLDTTAVRHPRCFGEASGEVSLVASGGSGLYQFGADGLTYQPDSTLTGLVAGVYRFQVVDDSLCRDTFALTLTEPPLLELSVAKEDIRCFGETTGSATLDVRGGTPPFAATWYTEPPQFGARAEELPAGTWKVKVVDSKGCADSTEVTIVEPPLLELTLVDTVGAYCELPNGSGEAAATGGTPPYFLEWRGRDTLTGFSQTSLWGGAYTLILQDANGCRDSLSFTLSDPPAPQAAFSTDPPVVDSLVWDERDAILFLNASRYARFYTWSFGDGSGSSLFEPEHFYANPGDYPVTLIAYDEQALCPDTAVFLLRLVPPGDVYFPNAFTPNNDGINDFFTLPGEGLSQIDIRIYSRWGREIRQLNSLSPGWDGRDANGEPVPEGVYVLQLRARANDGRNVRHTITVTLVR